MIFTPILLEQKGSSFLDKCYSFLCCYSNVIVYFIHLSSLSCLSNIFILLRKIKNFYNDLNSYLCFSSPVYYNRKVHHFWINVILPCVVLQMSLCPLSTCPLCLSNIFLYCTKIWILYYDLNGYLCLANRICYNRKVHHFWINVIHPCIILSNVVVPFVHLSSLSFKYFYSFAPKLRYFLLRSKWLLMFFKLNLLQQKGSSFLDKCHSFLRCSSNVIVSFVHLSSLSFKYFYSFAQN